MNIVIVGDGKVGYTLATYLAQEGHDVTIVDKDTEALEKAKKNIANLEKKLHDAKLQIAGLQQKIRKDDIKKARKKDKTES